MLFKNFYSKINSIYEGDDLGTAKIIFTLYAILPIAYITIIIASLLSNDYSVIGMIGITFVTTAFSRWLLLIGKFRQSVQFFTFSIIFILAAICTLGQGIHDIALITFPPLIVFSGQLLNKKDQYLTSGLIILAIAWLALGEKHGLYQPTPSPGVQIEFPIILVVLVISMLITSRMAKNLRDSLTKAHNEIEKSKTRTKELELVLETKSRLTNTVHGQIAESLSIIREILMHQSGTEYTKLFTQRLSTQIEAISIIHKRLHENDSEKYIGLNDYLRSLVLAYIDQPSWHTVSIKCQQGITLNIEQAMSLGLYLFETISCIQSDSEVEIEALMNNSLLTIQIQFSQVVAITKSTLSEIMVQQLNASVNHNESSGLIELGFSLYKKDT